MSRLAYHPTHPGWQRLRDALRAVDQTPGPTVPALFGGDDVDPDVIDELLPARD